MIYSKVTSIEVEDYIKSKNFRDFYRTASFDLKVSGLNFDITYNKNAINQEGYVIMGSVAQVIFINNYRDVEGIRLFTDNIANMINNLYPKIPKQCKEVMDLIMEISINFILIHELTHILQHENGRSNELQSQDLLKHNINEYRSMCVEIEANENAYVYMKKHNMFFGEIALEIKRAFTGKSKSIEIESYNQQGERIKSLYHKVYN